MPSSPTSSSTSTAKKRFEFPYRSRARKKHKLLDAIRDEPTASFLAHRIPADDEDAILRRSSRVRHAPDLLDSSPVSCARTKRLKDIEPSRKSGAKSEVDRKVKDQEITVSHLSSISEERDWKSRLRNRHGKGREKRSLSSLLEINGDLTEGRVSFPVIEEKNVEVDSSFRRIRRLKKVLSHDLSVGINETSNINDVLPVEGKECSSSQHEEKCSQADVIKVDTDAQLFSKHSKMLESAEKVVSFVEIIERVNTSVHGGIHFTVEEKDVPHPQSLRVEEYGTEDHESNLSCKYPELNVSLEIAVNLKDNIRETEQSLKDNDQKFSMIEGGIAGFKLKEGRRCGLCGCGNDGKPPKKLINESFDSENEAYEGSTASEEPNYNVWDGFGDGPEWLGRLLGPLHDRFGIARVWVHQHCAVWSPEVYFADLGCLKNVRAALCRGRALKCSRCGRPGATIGCRVDRCPKTYHLPCSRIEGCLFDHRKFLIACSDHRCFLLPNGNKHTLQIAKMKAKKLRLDLRKVSNEARRKDLETEEKWLENCGEDEEFLKREGRRLHRDILRIAPAYIGGSSETENLYQGWESVAGLENVIQCMKEVVFLPLLYPEFFASLGLTPPRGVLLHGYPGTGKTHVVRALIGACSRGDKRIAYFARKGADCLGKYVGDAERQLRLLFQVAERSQPSIIFFDEIDGLAPRRSKQQDQTHSSVVSTLLSLLDGLKSRGSVIVIGATNRPDAVDPALRRPGRFDREIYFSLPKKKDRSSILSLHTRSWPKPLSGSLLSWIADQTVGYAGADIQALCAQAAMHGLKRNCTLEQLLSSAAKGEIHGILPCLPLFEVEERDWLAALRLAPPPCSRREAGIAANDIVAAPLPVHLSPYFLLPLTRLLVSLYVDEQIWLPSKLFKASESVKNIIVLTLEQKGIPSTVWWSHLDYLIWEPSVTEKIESKLSYYGLLAGASGSDYHMDDESEEYEKCGDIKRPLQFEKPVGFRTLISGSPRSGQQHLASCLLHGFMGHIEIQKLSLATISQEGHGDMVHGLTQILWKCLNAGRCIIYMPRIDLWAIDETAELDVREGQINPEICQSVMEKVKSRRRGTSDIWNSFVEQVDSAVSAASVTILATCEQKKAELPFGLTCFFSREIISLANSTSTNSTIPRFFILVDGKFEIERVINSTSDKLSYDLIQHYIILMHERSHESHSEDVHKGPHADINSDVAVVRDAQLQEANDRKTSFLNNVSSLNHQSLHQVNSQDRFVKTPAHGFQDVVSRNGKALKGNSILAIATFGYQILRYPQFAELVWVTSKLKDGPCADASGPWKRWPFNTCVINTECQPDKRVEGSNSCNANDLEPSGVVRGLIAVGLLAYRGFYTSICEVSADVRKVLELLIGQIREKVFGRKDENRYFRILSQVAYFDDMVNSWGYMLQSLQADNSIAEKSLKSASVERLQVDKMNTGIIHIANKHSSTQFLDKSCRIASNIYSNGFTSINDEIFNTCKKLNDHMPTKSDDDLIKDVQRNFDQSSLAAKEFTNGDRLSEVEKSFASDTDQNPCLIVNEDIPPNHAGCNLNTLSVTTSFTVHQNDKLSCLYICCSNCTHMINMIARKMITAYVKASGCYSVDDTHDIITSSSLNILASFRKYFIADENCEGKLYCQTQIDDHNEDFKGMDCHCKDSENMEHLPLECDFHTSVAKDACILASIGISSFSGSKLTYFFKNGVLVPMPPNEGSALHCNFEKICMCSVVKILQSIKQTFDC